MNQIPKILISPDSFKGSASAHKISILLKDLILNKIHGQVEISCCPLADGGEGSLEAIESAKEFEKIFLKASDPLSEPVDVYYLIDNQSNDAYIELAQASGLTLVEGRNKIMHASTFGTGEQIRHAIHSGIKKITLFLGGSATCDAGIGIASALGVKFFNTTGKQFKPSAKDFTLISSFDSADSLIAKKGIEIKLAVDVNNPFFGLNGASHTYSAQKGANIKQIEQLDKGLEHFAGVVLKQTGKNLQEIKGSGAAGGTAGGLSAMFNACIVSGNELIFKLLRLEEKIASADLVLTGEGKIDAQSLNHKLLFGISDICNKYDKKLWAICGYFDDNKEVAENLRIEKIFSLASSPAEIKDSMRNVEKRMEKKSSELIHALIQLFRLA